MTRATAAESVVESKRTENGGEHEEPTISMEEAVGYAVLPCAHETTVADAIALTHDHVFVLVDRNGNIAPPGRCSLGLFEDDTRLLSYYELRGAGTDPVKLSAQVVQPYHAQIDLAVTDHAFGGDPWDPKHAVYFKRELTVDDSLFERLTLTNYLVRPIDYWIELRVACDFADIFEVRGWKRNARGEFFRPELVDDRTIRFSYRGRDGKVIDSVVYFRDRPDVLEPHRARWSFRLEPGRPLELAWSIGGRALERGRTFSVELDARRTRLAAEYDEWRAAGSRWSSDVEAFDNTLTRAIDDLRSLYIGSGDEAVISAGIPWYSTVFGRDSIITSLETMVLDPGIAVDTLRYLARHQGTHENAYTEEQPGRIMHELRRGELARSGEIPHVPYYGTIDATPLWLVLLDETWRWTGDLNLVRELLPNARRALEWIDRYGDLDGDGFVEYARTSARGLVNQGWKDSGDGVPYPDGTLPQPPIALIEVQGYVYDAKTRAAALFERTGDAETADRLRSEAERLRAQVLERFWIPELGTFALALDGEKRPIPTVTSNAGHTLWSRLADPARAVAIAQTLLSSDMFCGWGIRTLSARHPVFNPMSYHNGSVWPHDNALIVMGMSHYGLGPAALPVVDATRDAAAAADFNRLPELYCGMARNGARQPVSYPVSCSPQAWASGALFLMLQAVLGILPDAPANLLHIRNPVLPRGLQELTITNLRVGKSRVSLHFARRASRTLVNVLAVESDAEPFQVRIEVG
ncbi:MAG TPA: amylo-alpha-1,6-glucosidase [Gemmatimonadaceae bacterium]|nr:amylo-alpha-1,6-glucosidase [Gemmatimonadaceae bacterium]